MSPKHISISHRCAYNFFLLLMRDDQLLHLNHPIPTHPPAGGPFPSREWRPPHPQSDPPPADASPPTGMWILSLGGGISNWGPPAHPHPVGYQRVGHNPKPEFPHPYSLWATKQSDLIHVAYDK